MAWPFHFGRSSPGPGDIGLKIAITATIKITLTKKIWNFVRQAKVIFSPFVPYASHIFDFIISKSGCS